VSENRQSEFVIAANKPETAAIAPNFRRKSNLKTSDLYPQSPFPYHATAALATEIQETYTAFAVIAPHFTDFNV